MAEIRGAPHRRQDHPAADRRGQRGRARDRHPQAPRPDGLHHPRPGLRQHRARAAARSPSSTARRASCATAAIPIEELAEKRSFLEVAYLLIYGELPTEGAAATRSPSRSAATRCCTRTSSASTARCRRTPTRWRPASAAVGALATFYPDSLDPRDPRQVEISVHRLIAKLPTMAAYAFKHSIGQPFMYPDNKLRYVGNFLHLMFATPCEPYVRRPGDREGDRPAADPARRPRAELLDLARCGWCGSSMVNLFARDLGRHQRALGPAARRRQPGGDRDAECGSATRASRRASSSSAPRARTTPRA